MNEAPSTPDCRGRPTDIACQPCLMGEYKCCLYAPSTPVVSRPIAPVAELVISEEFRRFLNGESPLDGVWFGEKHPTFKGQFWWRKYLPKAAPVQPTEPEVRKPGPDRIVACRQRGGQGSWSGVSARRLETFEQNPDYEYAEFVRVVQPTEPYQAKADADRFKDAQRYRWLRNKIEFAWEDGKPWWMLPYGVIAHLDGDDKDAAIDAAMIKELDAYMTEYKHGGVANNDLTMISAQTSADPIPSKSPDSKP